MTDPAHLPHLPHLPYVLALHGGAGVIARDRPQDGHHRALAAALATGETILRQGGSACDAVLATVVALEDCPLFNAGHGAVFTAAGEHELDAALMDGATLRAGAVAGVRQVRNPILAAHHVLLDGRFVLLGGEGADAFARQAGLAMVENSYFSTELRRGQLAAVRAFAPGAVVLDHGSRFGTVGAVARDRAGHLAAATSTGGMTNKLPGRIGDTPLVGAGVYANDASCAVSATGTGEHFIRACLAHDVHARMVYGGAPLAQAATGAVQEGLRALGGDGGIIAVGADGSLAMPFLSRGMYRAWVREGDAAHTRIFAD
jgi:beta-aspartyl-peptidase (threonine type)